jgi:hypothetical protein
MPTTDAPSERGDRYASDLDPPDLDFTRPNEARMDAIYLGADKDTTTADREAAERVIQQAPDTPQVAAENFEFAARGAVWAVTTFGIDKVFDIGVGVLHGVPLKSVEQSVHEVAPDARVIAFDYDPVVCARARGLGPRYGGVLWGDAKDLDSICNHPELPGLGVDLTKPVVDIAAVLHFVPDPLAGAVTTGLAESLADGSVLILSHICSTNIKDENVEGITSAYGQSRPGMSSRTQDEIRALVEGNKWVLVDPPGVVDVARWELPEPHDGPKGVSVRAPGLATIPGGWS